MLMQTILICDDERDIVRALRIYLSDPDYRILEAYNGRDAVELIRREDVHLVLGRKRWLSCTACAKNSGKSRKKNSQDPGILCVPGS